MDIAAFGDGAQQLVAEAEIGEGGAGLVRLAEGLGLVIRCVCLANSRAGLSSRRVGSVGRFNGRAGLDIRREALASRHEGLLNSRVGLNNSRVHHANSRVRFNNSRFGFVGSYEPFRQAGLPGCLRRQLRQAFGAGLGLNFV